MQPFPARGDLAHASQHMANDTLMSFLRPTNTTFYTPSNRVYGARPMTVSGSPSPPRGLLPSPKKNTTPRTLAPIEHVYPKGRPLVGCELVELPWSMGYWGSHNVHTQPGSYSEALSNVPYNHFTSPPKGFKPRVL